MLTNESASPLLFRDVDFGYPKRDIITGLTWSAGRGVTALMGPNGAGKTTLLNLASGVLKPFSGSVHVYGDDVSGSGHGKRSVVSYLPQRFSFVTSMTLEQTVAHASWASGVPDKDLPGMVEKALSRVNLAERSQHKVKTLSGGQRQRLGVACALSFDPNVLLLDEPSVGLDPLQRRDLRILVRELADETPVVLSTHLVDDVAAVADHVAVLVNGQIRFDGTLTELAGADAPLNVIEDAYVDVVSNHGKL